MGKPVKLEDTFEDEQSRQEAYAEILATYKQVHQQGDGVKSFTYSGSPKIAPKRPEEIAKLGSKEKAITRNLSNPLY